MYSEFPNTPKTLPYHNKQHQIEMWRPVRKLVLLNSTVLEYVKPLLCSYLNISLTRTIASYNIVILPI